MAFVYPSNFSGTLWRVIDGDIYVSYLGSNLSGNGSPQKPFKSIQKAISVASPGAKIVIGTGEYSETVNGLGKGCKLFADGTVLSNGPSTMTAFSNMGANCIINGFFISGYLAAVNGTIKELSSCTIQSPLVSFSGTIRKCVLVNIKITGVNSVLFINSTLLATSSDSSSAIRRLESCHISNTSNLKLSTSVLNYFDYCNLQPGTSVQINASVYSTSAQVSAAFPGFQQHGLSVIPQFNHIDIGDYTLSKTSLLKNNGRNGSPIGALGEAITMGVQEILSGGSLSGVTLNTNNLFELPEGILAGLIETPIMDLGSSRPVRTIHLYADEVFDESLYKIVSYNAGSNLPGAITVEMRYSDDPSTINNSSYQPMIWELIPSHDKNFTGNGQLSFSVKDSNFITARCLQFRITLRNAEDFVLLAQEDYNLLLQEDEGQISI